MKSCARKWWRICAARFPAASRCWSAKPRKLALDLNQAQTAFQSYRPRRCRSRSRNTPRTQESCYRTEAALTAARGQVAELNLESERTRGRLELQAKQIGGIDERLAAGEAETQELEARQQREPAELRSPRAGDRRGLEAESVAAAGAAATPRRRSATRLQNDLRERERGIEAARQQVLRLLGEASTLRNQLAQIDEYLAAMERDSARARKEEESASADLARLEQVKAELSAKLAARQLELESLADRRRRVEEEIEGAPGAHRRGAPAKLEEAARGRFRGRRRARIRSKKFFRIAPTPPNRVKRLFTRRGARPDRRLQALRRAGGFRRSRRSGLGKSLRRLSCTKSWNTWWSAAGTKPSAAWN